MQTGTQIVSVRGEGAWSGMTTLTTSERGDRRLAKLENCYVNVDGSEIRTFPGMRCVVDLQTLPESRDTGYRRNFVDAMRPAFKASSNSAFLDSVVSKTAEKLYCWTNPTRFHSFHFVRGRLQIVGESDFRKEPIFNVNGGQVTISEIAIVGGRTTLTLSLATAFTDYGFNTIGRERPAQINPVGHGCWIYIEGVPAVSGSDIDTRLNNKFHWVETCNTGTNQISLLTTVTLPSPATNLAANIWRCRPGTSQYRQSKVDGVGYYERPTPYTTGVVDNPVSASLIYNTVSVWTSGQFNGWTLEFLSGQLAEQKRKIATTNVNNVVLSSPFPFAPKFNDKFKIYPEQYYPLESYGCDDPEALTSWTLIDKPDLSAPVKTAYVGQVANRIRDWGGTGLLYSGTATVTSGQTTFLMTDERELVEFAFREYDYHIYANITVGSTTQTTRVITTTVVNSPFNVAAGGNTVTITLTGAAFAINSQANKVVVNQAGQRRRILSNTANTITIDTTFTVAATSVTIYADQVTVSIADQLTVNGAATVEFYSLGRQEGGERKAGITTSSPTAGSNTGPFSFSRRRQKMIPYRPSPAISGDRLLLAVPGYGCVFQVPSVYPIDPTLENQSEGVPVESNDRANTIRCVGVPKAVLQVDLREYLDTAGNGTLNVTKNIQIEGVPNWNNSDDENSYTFNTVKDNVNNYAGTSRGGTYTFVVAYKDQQTGEIGLPSEPMSITTPTTAALKLGVTLRVLYPGYLMSECAAYSLLVFRSKEGLLSTEGPYYFMGEFTYGKQSESFFDTEYQKHGAYYESGPYAKYEPAGKYGLSIAWPSPTNFGDSANDSNAPAVFATIHNIKWVSDTDLEKNETAPPVLNQMPRGAKAVRTVRGWTFYGGSQGNCGENGELLAVKMISAYNKPADPPVSSSQFDWTNPDELATKPWPSQEVNLAFRLPVSNSQSETYLCAQDIIPPSYAGIDFLSPDIFPYPAQTSLLDRMVNIEVYSKTSVFPPLVTGSDHSWPRWTYTNSPFLASDEAFSKNGTAYLKLPRGRFQVSEQGFPSITPATSTGFLDNENDDDIEAIGQYGGQAILCSRLRTYTVGWSGSPITDAGVVPPEIASPEFGCIAANSMVEFDGGLAWISDRGPVAMTGEGVQWIGRELASDFFGETAKYKRDSNGMMRHSWACHDPERGLVYFGLFSNRNKTLGYKTLNISFRGTTVEWDTASDEAKSFFPCDEVLIWSYRSNAWSVYYPATRIHPDSSTYFGSTEILWMARGPDSTGTQRVYAMQADGRIYALIDENNDANVDGLTLDINLAGTATLNSFTEAVVAFDPGSGSPGQTYAKWASNEYLRAGMEAVITDSTGTVLKGRLAVKEWNLGNHEITLWAPVADQGAFSWVSGDKLVLGARTMRMTTNYLNMKGHSDRASVRRIGVRYSLRSKLTTIGTGDQLPAFARATARVNKRSAVGTSTPSPTNDVSLSAVTTVDTFDYLGKSYSDGSSRDYGFTRALPVGQEFSLTIEAIGTAQVAVQDIYAEVS